MREVPVVPLQWLPMICVVRQFILMWFVIRKWGPNEVYIYMKIQGFDAWYIQWGGHFVFVASYTWLHPTSVISVVPGLEREYMAVCTSGAVVDHKVDFAHLLIGALVQQNSIQANRQDSWMGLDRRWHGVWTLRCLPLLIFVKQVVMFTILSMQ